MGGRAGSPDLRHVRLLGQRDPGHDLPWHAEALAPVVPSGLVADGTETRIQRSGSAAIAGPRAVQDSVDLAAQVATGHGAAGRDRLSGRVEVDETYVGGPARGRQLGAKQGLVLVAAEEPGAGIGRIRLRRVADASAPSLEAFVREAVEPGSVVRTDGWTGYARLSSLSYQHEVVVTSGDEQRVSRHFPRVHRMASLLKRSLLCTHEGAVRPSYLDYYGRIHVSLQPPEFQVARQAVPTPDGASGSGRSRPSPADAGCCPWQGCANGPRSTGVKYIARSGNSSLDSVRKTTRAAIAIESTVLPEAGSSATATAQSGNS